MAQNVITTIIRSV